MIETTGIAVFGLIYIAIIAFVIYLVFRVVRAFEKIAAGVERISEKYEP